MDLSPRTLMYAASLLISNYMNYRCLTPPCPSSSLSNTKTAYRDSLKSSSSHSTQSSSLPIVRLVHHLLLTTWTYQLLLVLFPSARPLICLNPHLLNPSLFTWSRTTALAFTTTMLFGSLRLYSYTSLGTSFTYQLAAPKKLVTEGVYAYVRHPSYLGLFAIRCVDCFTVQRLDGLAACVLPQAVVGRWWVGASVSAGIVGATAACLAVRVREEEEMMEEELGGEWRGYKQRTWRFVPWVW